MKKGLLMFALVMSGIFIGNMIGSIAVNTESLNWLGKTYEIGFSTFELNLQLCVFTLGLQFRVCIAEVLLVLTALLSYPKLSKMIFG